MAQITCMNMGLSPVMAYPAKDIGLSGSVAGSGRAGQKRKRASTKLGGSVGFRL